MDHVAAIQKNAAGMPLVHHFVALSAHFQFSHQLVCHNELCDLKWLCTLRLLGLLVALAASCEVLRSKLLEFCCQVHCWSVTTLTDSNAMFFAVKWTATDITQRQPACIR